MSVRTYRIRSLAGADMATVTCDGGIPIFRWVDAPSPELSLAIDRALQCGDSILQAVLNLGHDIEEVSNKESREKRLRLLGFDDANEDRRANNMQVNMFGMGKL